MDNPELPLSTRAINLRVSAEALLEKALITEQELRVALQELRIEFCFLRQSIHEILSLLKERNSKY
ncbi:hypothetical protein [Aliterella atlantica]|uniref:Uncharacterized protein n=1 Tax=Aliterella atlantica CENA595 TaxID=1618023 RepID=A0A0D8ZUB5_9CYAN|nr:hypothetical protein [Aliterella atlantica]KJH72358.1 hypothetical protein UH38_08090 [Aliterella atlantica CENA595]